MYRSPFTTKCEMTTPVTVTESTKVLESIEATYTQGQTVVYPDTTYTAPVSLGGPDFFAVD